MFHSGRIFKRTQAELIFQTDQEVTLSYIYIQSIVPKRRAFFQMFKLQSMAYCTYVIRNFQKFQKLHA